jgi:ABC-type lipoprotein export system ATPase subunit
MVTHSQEYAKYATRRVSLFDGRIIDEKRQAA